MLTIQEVNTIEEFLKLKDNWNEALKKSKDDLVTLTWEHTYVSIKNMEHNQALRIVCLINNDQIVGIAPLRMSHYKIGLIGYKVIEPLDIGIATDYTGLIFAGQEIDCLNSLMKYLFSQKDWDHLYINDVPENSTIFKLATSNVNPSISFLIEKGEICPYLPIPQSMFDFLKNLRRSHRRDLARCLKNLERDKGKVELKDYSEIGSIDEALQIFFDLHQKRWTKKGETGAFSLQSVRKIFIDRARLFAEKGWLALYFLTVKGKPVAVNYGLKYNKKWYCCSTGFDTEYYQYSVGNLLLLKIIDECINQGYAEYDFMKGYEPYKLKWTSQYRTNYNLKLTNKRPTSQLIKLGLETKKRAIDCVLSLKR